MSTDPVIAQNTPLTRRFDRHPSDQLPGISNEMARNQPTMMPEKVSEPLQRATEIINQFFTVNP